HPAPPLRRRQLARACRPLSGRARLRTCAQARAPARPRLCRHTRHTRHTPSVPTLAGVSGTCRHPHTRHTPASRARAFLSLFRLKKKKWGVFDMASLPDTATFAEFARIAGFKRSYITQLRKDDRLVLEGRRVKVAESLALITDSADPAKRGVAERHAAA